MRRLIVYKDRTNVVQVSLGIDVSDDTFNSEIRTEEKITSLLMATWVVTFLTDGTDGELILTLDNSLLNDITRSSGFMDLKRVSNGEPLPVFESPIEVIFQESITE